MSMTRKHYQAFADMMAECKPQSTESNLVCKEAVFYSILQNMCVLFEQDNPRFDSERFAKWVGEKSTTITSG